MEKKLIYDWPTRILLLQLFCIFVELSCTLFDIRTELAWVYCMEGRESENNETEGHEYEQDEKNE